jgi:hypothetical protein
MQRGMKVLHLAFREACQSVSPDTNNQRLRPTRLSSRSTNSFQDIASMSSSQEIIIFDPSGDVLLLLESNDDQSDIIPAADEIAADEAPGEALAEEAQADSLVLQADPDNESSDSKPAKSSATSTREIIMQVSSKYLSLASKVFDDMFQCQPRDDVASQDRELLKIPLQKDDLESLQTLLYVVHGLTRRVSRQVERNQLLQIVVLIDKYEFYEVAEVFTDMWFESLQPTIPRNLRQDLASWIYICLELRQLEEFNTLTEIAIRETTCGLEDPDGLVPFWIVGKRLLVRNDKNIS